MIKIIALSVGGTLAVLGVLKLVLFGAGLVATPDETEELPHGNGYEDAAEE